MVIDSCDEKPKAFPVICDGCPWYGRCKFSIKPGVKEW